MSICHCYYCRHRNYCHNFHPRFRYIHSYHPFEYYRRRFYRHRFYQPSYRMYYIRGIGYVSSHRIRAALGAEYYKKRVRKTKIFKPRRFKPKTYSQENPFQDTYEDDYTSTELPLAATNDIGIENSY